MESSKLHLVLGLALALGVSATVSAWNSPGISDYGFRISDWGKAPQDDDEPAPPAGKQAAGAAEYEKAVKDLKKVEGPFTLYQRKKDLLLELPEDKLGKLFCLEANFNTGVMADGLQAGFPAGDLAVDVFRFERHDEAVWLVRPHLGHRWSDDDPLALSAERSFPDAILGTFNIEQKNPDKKLLLINVTNLFYGDAMRLGEAVQTLLGGPYMVDRAKSGPDSVKGFPENTVVRMSLHYVSQGRGENPLAALLGLSEDHLEDGRSAPMKVTYNLWFRKDDGYRPRLADPRVGYFTSDYFDLSRFESDNRNEQVIARWNLKKKDPQAAKSEPVKPILWMIDPSVPKEYRQACADGILQWNRAFDAIGYKDAIQVKFVPDGDKEWDHADGRFNVLRWTMSEDATYAITLPRFDPITGQIMNASVSVDANILYAAFREKERLVNPGSAAYQRSLDVLSRNDARDAAVTPEAYMAYGDAYRQVLDMKRKMASIGWQADDCAYAVGLTHSAAFGWDALLASGKPAVSREQYAKELIRSIVAHEVGHSMGLRHNFIASTYLTTAQLADDKVTSARGLTASVMDYTPANVVAIVKGARNYYASCIGEYDLWAIKYGYQEFASASTPASERFFLSQIASQSGKSALRYMTDEEADGFDPYVVRFDCGKDPLAFSEAMLQATDRVMRYAITHLPRKGESYGKRTQMVLTSLTRRYREGMAMARFVGGIAANRNFKGDQAQGPTLAPVSPVQQRQAMRLIVADCFSQKAFALPQDVMMNLSMDVDASFGAPASAGWQAPLRNVLGQQASMLYSLLMSAASTQRIAENEYKWSGRKDAYTMSEHFATLMGAVFSEIGANKSVSPLRRDLQRFAANALITQAGAAPGGVNEDVRMLASDSLRRLSARIGGQLKRTGGLDAITVVHLRDTKAAMDRFLARSVSVSR